ncbi:MAG: type II toxin-antitoxin system VapC family toxin [Mycobacteriaceae bacterium]
MTIVLDSSVAVAALIDTGSIGEWAESILGSGAVAAPHLMPAEVANILRRSVAAGAVTADVASLAHAEMMARRIELFPYTPFASRVWDLRRNVTSYDAWYVALAESLQVPLVTLDGRLALATGPRCEFIVPPAAT